MKDGGRPGVAPRRDGAIVVAVALAARLAVVVWGAARFPPSGDGRYFDVLARRIAEGHGYTWAWPDGAVTNVAHYPVGYPALVALAYRLLGERPAAGMLVNAVFGAAMAWGVFTLVRPTGSRARAMAAGLAVALHPALVPYTAALMTEGVATAAVVIAAALARARPERPRLGAILAGVAIGVATLVRPQCLALAPVLGWIAPVAPEGWGGRLRSMALVTGLALATCAPWTARNCVAMHRCALVSVNGGWNLLIGAQTQTGAWQEVETPAGCRTVWDEAAKDSCFGDAARGIIARDPAAWLARAPAKLAVTFDYFGAGPWYLHLANSESFGDGAKWWLGAVETVASRVALLFALAAAGLAAGPRRPARGVLGALGALASFTPHGWPAYLGLAASILLLGARELGRRPLVVPFSACAILVTAATHAVFFGAGRYGLAIVPLVTALPFAMLPALREPREGARS